MGDINSNTATWETQFDLVKKLADLVESGSNEPMKIGGSKYRVNPTNEKQYLINDIVVSETMYINHAVDTIVKTYSGNTLAMAMSEFITRILREKPYYVSRVDYGIMKAIK
jgi:hypothetical protein